MVTICDCCCGAVSWQTGPYVCDTQGHGYMGCCLCCVIWPFNCIIGTTWGILDTLTCHCCDHCGCCL